MSVPRPLAPSPVEVPAKRHGRLGSGVGPRLFLLAGAGLAWLIPALWNPDIFLCARNLGRCSVSRVSMGPVSSAGRFQTQSEAPLARNTLNQRRFGRDDLCKQSNESRPADRCYG
jgi:hypothetical protein